MFVYEFKCLGTPKQYQAVDEAIRTSQFIRNKCLRYWMDNRMVNGYDLNKYTARLAKEFPFAALRLKVWQSSFRCFTSLHIPRMFKLWCNS